MVPGGSLGVSPRSWSRDGSVVKQKLAPGTVRRVGAFARPFGGQIAAYLGLVVVDAVLTVLPPLLAQRIVDDGVLGHDAGLVTTLALVVAGLAVVAAGVGLVERWYSARIGEGSIYALRTQVFAHVQRMPIAFFTRTQTGALISRLNNDVLAAQRAFTSTLAGTVSNLVSLVLVAGTMFYLAWQITLVSLLLLPLFVLPAKWIGRRLQALTREQMQLNAEMSTVMTERFNVSGAMLAKIFGRPEEEDALFSARAARVRDVGVRIALVNRVFATALTLVAALATALVYLIGGHLAVDGRLTVGTLVALTVLLGRLYGPLTALANVRVDVMTALVSFERVFEVLDLVPMVADKPGAAPLPADAARVEFDGVGFHYPAADEVSLASLESVSVLDRSRGDTVLHDVSFTAEPGQVVALVGPSGAGKTTITSLVARLYDATDGAVRIGGHDVRDVTLESLRDAVGVVTQDSHMFHDTIRGNLLYARPGADEAELWDALHAAHIADLVGALPDGLDTVVGERGHRLSGGEKQRLAIARLLLKAPRVVVLDEATAHLDSESEAAVQQALANALRGRTALVIAHRLSTIRDADQILVVDAGRIAERGRHDELLALGGTYADLYHRQFGAGGTQDPDAAPDQGTEEPALAG
ncbi:ABC transporter ATP-binding protein [Yinghuangia seranimata]|uniref:ABC transporter ATP-binding protein n=1 Tax=Yinghuangia seranimata TaxID=408067 RepID=UPI00248B912A|nr:ABC transporter ATP-binding protein [Yinghuangia seranimata]MDI2126335.1 ABC transporter ATP-binding protein [Yinghuangia seranimata]